jgi:2-polyprenyl-3-methyl-5-hydroxy-6-metoxy-1,4-benzoquinol methylase/spore coat polysaccharide biosynthesis predicted glycosyltransferase SpsG
MPDNILFVPSISAGNGTGHLKRVLKLGQEMNSLYSGRYFIYMKCDSQSIIQWKRRYSDLEQFEVIDNTTLYHFSYDLIVLDQRETSRQEFLDWEAFAPVILLDEGGSARNYGSLLIDSLPGLQKERANFSNLSYLDLPIGKKKINWENPSLLLSFGGEDPANLTIPVMKCFLEKLPWGSHLAVVQGPLMDDLILPPQVQLYKDCKDLTPLYKKYDILIGSFGMTPLEAVSAGCAVLLVNPSVYHEKLSENAGFISAGVKNRGIKNVWHTYQEMIDKKAGTLEIEKDEKKSLPRLINSLEGVVSSCPLCQKQNNKVQARFQGRTYYLCRQCHNYYLVNWQKEEEKYDKEYFFSRYKEQYGKTYLEDFNYIKEMGRKRLKEIGNIIKKETTRKNLLLTDLGCAFGPFLAAAGEEGYSCRGVEINREGADWVRKNLAIPVINGSLTEPQVKKKLRQNKTDILTLWYVIEHIPNQESFLNELNQYLKPNGLLAFGTPSGRGISAKKSKISFLSASPADHFVIYTPQGVRRILSKAGFTVKKIKSVGHHPERFGRWVGEKGSIIYNMVMLISRIFSLGDSLEVYALKVSDKEHK